MSTALETPPTAMHGTQSEFIKWFADTGIGDVPLVGEKNASLAIAEKERAFSAEV